MKDADALELENQLINFFCRALPSTGDCFTNIRIGDNTSVGGDTLSNHPHKEEISKRISDTIKRKGLSAGKNNPCYGKFGKDHPAYGYRHTDEAKKRIAAKLSKLNSNGRMNGKNNPMYGRNHGQDTKRKMSEAVQGKYIGAKNPNAKKYRFTSPSGKIHIVHGQRKLFAGWHQLSPLMIGKLARGEMNEYKGWKCETIT